MPSRLAVVLATFNGAHFLSQQLQSIATQTRRPDELIVSDDGSTDETRSILADFAAAPHGIAVTVLDGPCTGLADNFWHGLQATECDLIAWSDQDDVWRPDKLARSERALEGGRVDFVTHSAEVVDRDASPTGHRYPDYRIDRVRRPLHGDPWHVPSGFATMFRRTLVDGIDIAARPVSHQTLRAMNHDHVVSLAAFASGRRAELRHVGASYRQHGSNAAGDPSVHGSAAVLRSALRVGAAEYEALADITDGYAAFAETLPRAMPGAGQHLRACAARVRRRAELYSQSTRGGRVRALAAHLAGLDYGLRGDGRLPTQSLARDVLQVAR